MHRTIAAVSIVILLGWTSSLQGRDLDRITIEPNTMKDGTKGTIVIKAYDTSGKLLPDVIITLDGAGISEMKTTNSNGIASFTFTPDLLGQNYGEIQVMAKYTGTILVQVPGTIIVNS